MAESVPEQRNPADPQASSVPPMPTPNLVRSLLEFLAAEPGSGLVEIQPGVYLISKDFTAEELNRD